MGQKMSFSGTCSSTPNYPGGTCELVFYFAGTAWNVTSECRPYATRGTFCMPPSNSVSALLSSAPSFLAYCSKNFRSEELFYTASGEFTKFFAWILPHPSFQYFILNFWEVCYRDFRKRFLAFLCSSRSQRIFLRFTTKILHRGTTSLSRRLRFDSPAREADFRIQRANRLVWNLISNCCGKSFHSCQTARLTI